MSQVGYGLHFAKAAIEGQDQFENIPHYQNSEVWINYSFRNSVDEHFREFPRLILLDMNGRYFVNICRVYP